MQLYAGKLFTDEIYKNFNSFTELYDYFFENVHPDYPEFTDFWASLTDQEKIYFRTVDLQTGIAAYLCE